MFITTWILFNFVVLSQFCMFPFLFNPFCIPLFCVESRLFLSIQHSLYLFYLTIFLSIDSPFILHLLPEINLRSLHILLLSIPCFPVVYVDFSSPSASPLLQFYLTQLSDVKLSDLGILQLVEIYGYDQ